MWQDEDPIYKLEKYLKDKGWFTDDEKKEMEKATRKEVIKS